MGAHIPKFNGTLKEKVMFYSIIALIYCAIALIIKLSPSSPKEDTTNKTLTNTISNK